MIVATGGTVGDRAAKAATSDHSDRLHHRRRSGQARPCRQPQPAGGQRHRRQPVSTSSWRRSGSSCCASWCRSATSIAALVNPSNPTAESQSKRLARQRPRALGLQVLILCTQARERDIDAAFAALAQMQRRRAARCRRSILQQPARATSSRWRHAIAIPAIYEHARIRRSRRPDELRNQLRRRLSPSRHLYRPHSQRREARRPAGRCSRPNSNSSSTCKTAKALGLDSAA